MMGDTPAQTPRRAKQLNGSTVRADRRNFSQSRRAPNLEETRNTIMRNLGRSPAKLQYADTRNRTETTGSPVRKADSQGGQMDDLIDLSDDPFNEPKERYRSGKRTIEERRPYQSFIPPPSTVRKKRKSLTESIERRRSGEHRYLGSPKRLPPEFWASSADIIYTEPTAQEPTAEEPNEQDEQNQQEWTGEEPDEELPREELNEEELNPANQEVPNEPGPNQQEPMEYEDDEYEAYNSSANGQLSLLEPEHYDEPLNNGQEGELEYKERLANLEAKHQAEIASYRAQLVGRDREISALQSALEESKQQLSNNAWQRSELATKVSTHLHEQYSRKHQAKVNALKKGYETRWKARVSRLEAEVSRLQELVKKERDEKNELVKTCDQFLDMMNQSGQ